MTSRFLRGEVYWLWDNRPCCFCNDGFEWEWRHFGLYHECSALRPILPLLPTMMQMLLSNHRSAPSLPCNIIRAKWFNFVSSVWKKERKKLLTLEHDLLYCSRHWSHSRAPCWPVISTSEISYLTDVHLGHAKNGNLKKARSFKKILSLLRISMKKHNNIFKKNFFICYLFICCFICYLLS